MPPRENRRDNEIADRDPQIGESTENSHPRGVQTGFLVRFPQGRRCRVHVDRLGDTTRKGRLTGVGVCSTGPLDQQHVGAVSEQNEHCGMATTAVDRHEASHVRGLHARKRLRQRVQPRWNPCDGVLVGEPLRSPTHRRIPRYRISN